MSDKDGSSSETLDMGKEARELSSHLSTLGLTTSLVLHYSPRLWKWAEPIMRAHPKQTAMAAALALVIYSIWKAIKRRYAVSTWLMSYFMSKVTVFPTDTILYRALNKYLAKKDLVMDRRSNIAKSITYVQNRSTEYQNYYSDETSSDESTTEIDTTTETKGAITYDTGHFFTFFREGRRVFVLTKATLPPQSGSNNVSAVDTIESLKPGPVRVWVFGWSPRPIYDLLGRLYEVERESDCSVEILKPERGYQWQTASNKRPRAIDSVYLDQDQKDKTIHDLTVFLDPATKRWYEATGFPYRRGYLLYGPPGCGKTSLVRALVGNFGLKVYTLALRDQYINDQTLEKLFNMVPARSIILLEDIDSAGIGRELHKPETSEHGDSSTPTGRVTDYTAQDTAAAAAVSAAAPATINQGGLTWTASAPQLQVAQTTTTVRNKQVTERKSNATLSGLINAVDGVNSPEGTILILSTNHPEALDKALIRAGRINQRIEFSYASRKQLHDIFYNMYMHAASILDQLGCATESIPVLADEFADSVPVNVVTPGQVQDYILDHSTCPDSAVRGLWDWLDEKSDEDDEFADRYYAALEANPRLECIYVEEIFAQFSRMSGM